MRYPFVRRVWPMRSLFIITLSLYSEENLTSWKLCFLLFIVWSSDWSSEFAILIVCVQWFGFLNLRMLLCLIFERLKIVLLSWSIRLLFRSLLYYCAQESRWGLYLILWFLNGLFFALLCLLCSFFRLWSVLRESESIKLLLWVFPWSIMSSTVFRVAMTSAV